MKSNYFLYNHENSVSRIDEILNSSDYNYEEVDEIPSREKLTFTNGFYVNCTSIFIDLRGSSELPNKYKRPRLARIYRAYISECVAVMNGNLDCREINIQGDCVWGIFNTPIKPNIDNAFSTCAHLNSLINILNCRFKKKGIDSITAGIGIDYGRALMIKAGYKGSSINEIVWMGDVVNGASKLCSVANKGYGNEPIMVANVIYNNLDDKKKSLLTPNYQYSCYHGNIINTNMDDWCKENCD